MRALVVLTHSECKRLIAKGLMEHPEIKEALKSAKIFVSRGSTTAYVLEEILGEEIDKFHYVAGQVTGNKETLFRLGSLNTEKRLKEVVIEKGKKIEIDDLREIIKELHPGDIIIKGANTLDYEGIAGVYMAHPVGGTVGAFLPIAIARGISVIVPVSISRSTNDSVWELAQILGNETVDPKYSMGHSIGIMPIPGEVFTELEAFDLLYPEVNVFHIGSSGVGTGEGSLHFLFIGEDDKVKEAFNDMVKLAKEEPVYIPDEE